MCGSPGDVSMGANAEIDAEEEPSNNRFIPKNGMSIPGAAYILKVVVPSDSEMFGCANASDGPLRNVLLEFWIQMLKLFPGRVSQISQNAELPDESAPYTTMSVKETVVAEARVRLSASAPP